MNKKFDFQNSFRSMLKMFVLSVLILSMLGTSLIFGNDKHFIVTENVTADEYKSTLPKITFADKGSAGMVIKYDFKSVIVSPIYVEGERYYMPHIYGFSHIEDIGSPRLPARNLQFAVPYGAKAVVKILDAKYKEFTKKQINIHPAIAPHPDCYNCPEPKFEIDPAVYAKDALFPKKPVQIISRDTFRGIPIVVAQVRPIQYNPVTGKFRVFSMLKFKVVFEGGERSFDRFSGNSEISNRMVKRAVLNSESIPRGVAWGRLGTRAVGKDYIIITHSNYLSQANTLANWKRQMGYSVEVVSQSSWTAAQIDTALKDRYNSWTPKPLYFLIIGDENTAPPEYTGSRYTDLYFAEMGGSGWKPEMAYGRLPVSSTTEATTVVNKIIDYEKTPPTQSSFYTNALAAAMYQDTDNYDSYADRRFCHTSEDMRNYLMTQGYTVNRVYATGSSSVDPYYYNNGHYSPSGMQIPNELKRPNFDWNDDATDINNSINAGRFIVTHRDHGGTTLWGDPYYTTTNIGQLSNGSLLPIVFSINCLTGKYVTSTECFAEKFLTRTNGGCVGIFAATEVSYSGYNDGYACGAMDAIWPSPGIDPQFGSGGAGNPVPSHSAIYTMGDVLNQAKHAMTYLWSDNQTTWELHHYYGDPAMQMWTAAPTTTTASHPTSLTTSDTTLSITSSNCAYGIATLVYADTLVGKTTLSSGGTGTITFAALSGTESTAVLTISKHNYKPYVSNITVQSGPVVAPVANFSASATTVYAGSSVNFTDLSSNGPTSWSWTFNGGTPSSSTAQNPSITYNTIGTYTVSLTATNSAGSDNETKTNYITVEEAPITYCSSQGNDYSYEWIANVQVSDISNSSGAAGYTDFTSIEGDLEEGAAINVSCTPGFSSSTYTEHWKIYIDYNIDGDFTDAGEEVFYSISTGTVTGSFVVPTGVSGQTRMRVSMKYNAEQTPCETFAYGEVEDYTVNLIPSTPQPPVANFTASATSISVGGSVSFTDTSTNSPTSWSWSFEGGTPSSSTSQNPSVTYNTAGTYNVSLTATNAYGSDGETKTDYITVTETLSTVGITSVLGSTSTSANRRAMPFTMPENGTINSVTIYHEAGSGGLILAVYDGSSAPTNRLAVSNTVTCSGTAGWQTVNLTGGAYVSGGSTVWLAWVFESNPGIRYETGSPGRYQSTDTWSGGMPDPFGTGSQADFLYSIYAEYTPGGGPTTGNVGITSVGGSTSTSTYRRAMPFTMPENGTIKSVSMYHAAGSGGLILAVYDGSSAPTNRIATTGTVTCSGTAGWQTVNLTSPVYVSGGSTVWLAWVYESNPGIAYETGSPGRYQSTAEWSGGMPDPFGTGAQADFLYSIYATYDK